jgi:hypothetical protein
MSLANVITPDKTLPGGNPSAFPAMMWKPDGSSYLAADESEVQPDSTPYHPDNAPEKAPAKILAPAVQAPKMTRDEIVKHLTEGGIAFDPTMKDKKLYALLVTALKNALAAARIEFDPESNDAPALLELLPKE